MSILLLPVLHVSTTVDDLQDHPYFKRLSTASIICAPVCYHRVTACDNSYDTAGLLQQLSDSLTAAPVCCCFSAYQAALMLGYRCSQRPKGYWDSLEMLNMEIDEFIAGKNLAMIDLDVQCDE